MKQVYIGNKRACRINDVIETDLTVRLTRSNQKRVSDSILAMILHFVHGIGGHGSPYINHD